MCELFGYDIFVRTHCNNSSQITHMLSNDGIFLYSEKCKKSIFDTTTKIHFFDILSLRLQDFIILYRFLMSLDIWNTPTIIFMGSNPAPKMIIFSTINHVVVKRGVIHEEFLWKLFFRKVRILLNISIYYHFFISHMVVKL